MKIVVLPSACDNLSDGYDFYERQADGLGDYLRLYAGIHSKSFGYYRSLSKRFPYAIYYDFEKEIVRIWAVLDCRQDPATVHRRLRRL